MHQEHQDQRRIRYGRIGEEDAAEKRNIRKRSQWDYRKLAAASQPLLIEEAGDTQGKDIDHRATDDLVNFESDRHKSQQQARYHSGQDANENGEQQVAHKGADQERGKSSYQHLTFYADVHNAASFADEAA